MVPKQLTNPHFHKIGILRCGALGDMLVSLPAIYTLRNYFPTAELVLLTNTSSLGFTQEKRFPVDRCIALPPNLDICPDGEKHWSSYPTSIDQLKSENFDLLINFQGKGIAANPFIEACSPKTSISFKTDHTQITYTFRYSYYQSEAIRLWELLHPLGINQFYPEALYKPTKQDHDNISSFLNEYDPFVAIAPFSNDLRRNWITDRFIPVIEYLRRSGYEVILLGALKQATELQALHHRSGSQCTILAGSLSIPQIAALLSRAHLVIAPDNGILHLARAVNTPTIGMYWAPNLINWGPLTRHHHEVLISWDLHCPICHTIPVDPYPFHPQSSCKHQVSFIQSIQPEQVIQAIQACIKNKPFKKAHE